MKLSSDVFDAFAKSNRDLWIIETADKIKVNFPAHFDTLGTDASALEQICSDVEMWARAHRITGRRDVAKLCVVAVSLGHRFWTDPRFATYISNLVETPNVDRTSISRLLTTSTKNWLSNLWNGDDFQSFVTRLEAAIVQNTDNTDDTLRYIVPNHWSMFTETENGQFLTWLRPQLPHTNNPAKRTVLAAGALIFGTNWWHDPQYTHVLQDLQSESDIEQQLGKLISTFREMN